MESKADLVALAEKLNPVVGYWDPMGLADRNFWGQGEEATIGFLREAEIKHGRIAMAGFVGFIVHSNDIRTQGDGIVASIPTGLSAPAVWDAMPEIAKWQIILFVGVMEAWRENKVVLAAEGQTHYMKGGKPGAPPPSPSWQRRQRAQTAVCARRRRGEAQRQEQYLDRVDHAPDLRRLLFHLLPRLGHLGVEQRYLSAAPTSAPRQARRTRRPHRKPRCKPTPHGAAAPRAHTAQLQPCPAPSAPRAR